MAFSLAYSEPPLLTPLQAPGSPSQAPSLQLSSASLGTSTNTHFFLSIIYSCLFVCFVFLRQSLCVALAVLELTMKTMLASNSQRFSCLLTRTCQTSSCWSRSMRSLALHLTSWVISRGSLKDEEQESPLHSSRLGQT